MATTTTVLDIFPPRVALIDPKTGLLTREGNNAFRLLFERLGGYVPTDAWPIGSIYTSIDATNPASTIGYGTWVAFGAGRTLVGLDSGDADFDTSLETGGAKTAAISAHAGSAVADHASHTHTYTDVLNHTHAVSITDPGHVHAQQVNTNAAGGLQGYTFDATTDTGTTSGYSTDSATTGITAATANPAGGVATGTTAGPSAALSHSVTQPSNHSDVSVVQPYIVVYFWRRTA